MNGGQRVPQGVAPSANETRWTGQFKTCAKKSDTHYQTCTVQRCEFRRQSERRMACSYSMALCNSVANAQVSGGIGEADGLTAHAYRMN
jgi:hypothetical protein